MGLLLYDFLSPEVLSGFSIYKYSAIDTSPLSRYVCHPVWNWMVRFVPHAVAPNTLTLTGFMFTVTNYFILSYYDYNFFSAGISNGIPQLAWLICAIFHVTAYTLDGLDGKHARQTRSSSPMGELFDHGLDSWTSTLIVMALMSVFGVGIGGIEPTGAFHCLVATLFVFFSSHWEKYNTGILFLPWTYDLSQWAVFFLFLAASIGTTQIYVFNIYFPVIGRYIAASKVAESILLFGTMLFTIPVTLYNLYAAHKQNKLLHSFVPGMMPLLPFAYLTITSYAWAYAVPATSSSSVLHPGNFRLFCFAYGAVASNICCRLIISQMTKTRAHKWTPLLWVWTAGWLLSMAVPSSTGMVMRLLVWLCTAMHIHYGCNVVRQLADHLNIYVFSIAKRPTMPKVIEIKHEL